MLKRGYENGEKTIEIYEGKIDLVLYNEKVHKPSFYYYRFNSEYVLGEQLERDVSIVHKHEVKSYLDKKGIDYDTLVSRLLEIAWSENMPMRDEM